MKDKVRNKNIEIRKIILIFLIMVVIFILLINFNLNNCNISINFNLNESSSRMQQNYILFLDNNGISKAKLVETNGWLLLEAVLEKNLTGDINSELANATSEFYNSTLFGWWPEEKLKQGKTYFIGGENVRLYYDADDTSWGHRLYGTKINPRTTHLFLSNTSLSEPFDQVCLNINCKRDLILRVWSNQDWHDDIDIVITSNFITILEINSSFLQEIFESNKQLINFIIENKNIDNYFKYYEPKATGYFLLLYYDDQGPKILSSTSRSILLQKFNTSFHELDRNPLIARWGGGEDWFYGCSIITVNERIPALMRRYASIHLGFN